MIYSLDNLLTKIINYKDRQKIKQEKKKDFNWLTFPDEIEKARVSVLEESKRIYGENWNYYSNALRKDSVEVFWKAIQNRGNGTNNFAYLEIGSAQGLSMSIIGLLLKAQGLNISLFSVDPYFEAGYNEGGRNPFNQNYSVFVNKETRNNAQKLYHTLGINVHLIEKKSNDGLTDLIKEDKSFDLIYIDGSHELLNPIIDFGLSFSLVKSNGIIMLDDYLWKDVKIIKNLCDAEPSFTKIHESWKIAAYQVKK